MKDKVYEIVLKYFLDLVVLLDCYDKSEGEEKQKYANKIARYVQQTPENWLKIIPAEYQARAFSIIWIYLELQRRS